MDASGKLKSVGTWRRYKLGQAQFTSWLKQTAEKLVTRKPAPDAPSNEDAATQLSRRQRKKKAKAAAAGIALSSDPRNEKSVHWSQLEVLAQDVADNAELDDVPDAALNILRDVVDLRKKSYKFFSSATKDTKDEKVKQSNASHAHIISVLERVLAKLEALVAARGSRGREKEPRGSARVNTSDLNNMFAHLEVQTPSDVVDGYSDGEQTRAATSQPSHRARKKATKKPQKARKPERRSEEPPPVTNDDDDWVDEIDFGLAEDHDGEEDEFDLYMMVYCFFEDFNTIRNHIAERWCDYWYDRSVPLDTLAVITNAAFELFHQLESDLIRELRPLHPGLARYDFMMDMLFISVGIDHIDYDSYDGLTEEETNERIWKDEADWLAFPSFATLERTLQMIPPGKVPMTAPSLKRKTVYGATTVDAWRDFESSVTMQIILEGAHLKALKTNEQEPPILPAEPQLLVDFENCLRRYDYTSALIFSLHLWVDIRNIIETDHVQPFEQLQKTVARLKQALEAHNPIKFSKDHALKRRWVARIWETRHYMLEDFTFEDKKARFRAMGVHEDPDPFYLLKHEPVWAGLLDFRAKLVNSQLGHEFVMLSPVVDAAAYVYHAALARDPDLPPWEGVRKYLDTYVDGSQFKLGFREEHDPVAILRNFQSLPVAQHTGERGGPADVDKTFTPAIRIRQVLYDRYAFDEKRIHSDGPPRYLRELTALRLQIARSARDRDQDGLERSEREAEEPRRKATLSQLSPLEMLQLLDDVVTSQLEGLLTLDYFELFDDSVALLESISAALGSELQDRLGTKASDSPAYLGRLPPFLAEHLDQSSSIAREEILDTVVRCCRSVFQAK
ncbi:hypothetical protein MMYC01_208901 [Madurella mycetomatis]|uniref:DUF6604 domain-containing protein n=1 Tax=Madurella mycetomatis TaxID=100816 RepID=A0A175VWM3_9PEZI|nr:hypothetical protein MMYC01_208901 [Madurella mycetomatis]